MQRGGQRAALPCLTPATSNQPAPACRLPGSTRVERLAGGVGHAAGRPNRAGRAAGMSGDARPAASRPPAAMHSSSQRLHRNRGALTGRRTTACGWTCRSHKRGLGWERAEQSGRGVGARRRRDERAGPARRRRRRLLRAACRTWPDLQLNHVRLAAAGGAADGHDLDVARVVCAGGQRAGRSRAVAGGGAPAATAAVPPPPLRSKC